MENPTAQTLLTGSSEPGLASASSEGEIIRSHNIERLINMNHRRVPSKTIYSDRFIPSRTGSNFDLFHLPPERPEDSVYSRLLRSVLFGPNSGIGSPTTPENRNDWMNPPSRNIFRYQTETRRPLSSVFPLETYDAVSGDNHCPVKAPRKIPEFPYKKLDAPELADDFYLNLVDWSSHNVVGVGLGNCVYLWNACSNRVTKLCDLGMNGSVCSLGWAQRGTHLAVGTSNGEVQIWDASHCKAIRTMKGHRLHVGALAWSSTLLSSGGGDKNIFHRDMRAQEDFVSKLSGHKSEVCGLKWSYDNRQLASGGKDNRLLVWNKNSTQPLLRYSEHTAPVKAIAWSPHAHGLLASGGGIADQCIRFWNTTTNSRLSCIDTRSEVCNIVWSKNVNELVSTHGLSTDEGDSQNQIIVWEYPTMSKLAALTGHTYRVLYLAVSPDGQNIVTGDGDETLMLWNIFPHAKSQNKDNVFGTFFSGRTTIR